MSKFNDLINGEVPVLLDIYANWCAPCKVLSPILKEIKSDFKESLIILKIDIDKNNILCEKLQVKGVPSLILYKSGKLIWKQSGLITKNEIKNTIENKLSKN
tara:strand:+ start:1083 stop:1388 length:306 start_codon:yes stop_codon:yes gene_type:complete